METVGSASAAIVVAASALMTIAAARLIPTATPTMPLALIALISLGGLATGRVAPVYVVLASGLLRLLM